jgi:D-glycero-D-manno-heptose 1,7-bisphosphate phosphatase
MTAGTPKRRKVCFVDRDGTLIADKHYLSNPEGVEILDGVVAGLRLLMEADFAIAVVTNQSGIGRGYYEEEDMHRVNDRIGSMLAQDGIRVDGWFFCPHHPDEGCDCRKPRAGLANQAARALSLDISRPFVIGDSDADIGFARAIGAVGVRVLTGRPGIPNTLEADKNTENFEKACRFITAGENRCR